MKPYYEEAGITIYHGDCRDILPHLPKVDLVLTDPPYGISLKTAYRQRGRGRLAKCRDYPEIIGDEKPFNPKFLLELNLPMVLWGANYYADKLFPASGWLVWDKRVLDITNDQADCELAWTNFVKGVRIFRHMWNGFLRDSQRGEGNHPAEKPVRLINWILGLPWTPTGVILDPFMGSGTTLRAAKDLGRKAIGIEIEEKYCEIAANRLSQEVLPLAPRLESKADVEQSELFSSHSQESDTQQMAGGLETL